MTPADALSILRSILDMFLMFFPVDVVRDELDAAAQRRANTAADSAEAIKFGSHR